MLACDIAHGQQATRPCPEEVTKPLLQVALDKRLQETDPVRVRSAIQELGEKRCVEAIDDLVRVLTFRYPWVNPDERVQLQPVFAGTGGCAGIWPLLRTPPQAFSDLGYSCLCQAWNFTVNTVAGGPNANYKYTTSPTNTGTLYQWERSPDLDNTGSVFYSKQTGTYNAPTNPSGCISGANLAAQMQRHEAGTVQSHWNNYKAAQDNSANNLGTQMEAQVGLPSTSESQFRSDVFKENYII